MKIININENSSGLTVDNTSITVDNTSITVDMNNMSDSTIFSIKITPRFYTDEVKLRIKNEMTEVVTNQECSATTLNGVMIITFNLYDVKDGNSYEFEVSNTSDVLMWRGNVYATNQTDLQDFKLNRPNNRNIIKL